MAALTSIIAAAGLAIGVAGAYTQYQGQKAQAAASQQSLALQERAETLRKRQMDLEAERRKREIIRASIQARSQAVTASVGQGAGIQSSNLPGAYGQIEGRTGTNYTAVSENQEIGTQMFGINQQMLGSYRAAAAGGSSASVGAGMSSFGGMLMNNAGMINKVGGYYLGYNQNRAM